MRKSRNDITPDTVFHDLLMNMLLIFMVLFIVTIIFVNPPNDGKNAEAKAEFLITLEWDNKSNKDIDIWVRDPAGNILSFLNKSTGLMLLDVDDLGVTTDQVVYPDGTVKTVELNREVVSIRGIIPGKYTVNVMFWNSNAELDPAKAKVSLYRVNPKYERILENDVVINNSGEEITAFSFVLDKNKALSSSDSLNIPFAVKKTATQFNTP